MRQRRCPADMVSESFAPDQVAFELPLNETMSLIGGKTPNQRQATAKESLIRLKTEKTDCLGRSKKP
jgi:hypothetical protein